MRAKPVQATPNMTTCMWCGESCPIETRRRQPVPDASLCPTCQEENDAFVRAIPAALATLAREIEAQQEEAAPHSTGCARYRLKNS